MADIDLPEIKLEPGESERPTLKTIARLLGLAVPTVSRALSDAPDIGADTKLRVRAMADRLGYRANRAGLRLRTGKTNVIALVLGADHDVMNHTAQLIHALSSALRATPYHLVVTSYLQDEDPLDAVKYIVETGSADGVILNRIQPDDPRVAYLRQHKKPFALHGRVETDGDAPYFDFDNAAFARQAITAFHHRARRHVLIIAPPVDQSYAQHLVAGAQDAAKNLGMTTTLLDGVTSDDPSLDVAKALTLHLETHPQTDAVLCPPAPVALAVAHAIEKLGRVMGNDIDLATKEAIALIRYFDDRILVCHEDIAQAGTFLADAVIRAIDEPSLPPLQKLQVPDAF